MFCLEIIVRAVDVAEAAHRGLRCPLMDVSALISLLVQILVGLPMSRLLLAHSFSRGRGHGSKSGSSRADPRVVATKTEDDMKLKSKCIRPFLSSSRFHILDRSTSSSSASAGTGTQYHCHLDLRHSLARLAHLVSYSLR